MNIRKLIGFETNIDMPSITSQAEPARKPRGRRSLFTILRRRVNDFIDEGYLKDTQVSEPGDTILLPEWMVAIYDEKENRVYYEPLRFCRAKIDDPSTEILYIGRNAGMTGDIQISEKWTGAKYIGRNHAVLVHSINEDTITLYEDDAKNKIFDQDGNSIHSIVIKDGTSVSLAGVIRMDFIHLGRAGVAEEELRKSEMCHKDFDNDVHLHRAAEARDSVPYNSKKHRYERS